jgi:hypothetical protein
MPPAGKGGKVGMSSCCSRAVLIFGNDVDLSGKMLMECYLAEDSCMSSDEGEEEEEVVRSEEYLLRQGETASPQYSTTTPATKRRQVPWRPKAYRHIVVVEKAGVEGSQRKLRTERRAGAVLMHVAGYLAGPYRLLMEQA